MTAIEQTDHRQIPHEPHVRKPAPVKRKKKNITDGQMELFTTGETKLVEMLKQVDISGMTPLDGLNFLNDMKKKAGI
jgi:DNA mismatch repair protein MutS